MINDFTKIRVTPPNLTFSVITRKWRDIISIVGENNPLLPELKRQLDNEGIYNLGGFIFEIIEK